MSNTLELLDQLQIGYGKHQLQFDSNHEAYDYIIKEANNTYAEFHDRTVTNLINQPASKVIPEFKTATFDWVDYFSQLSSTKQKDQLLNYSKALKKYYTIHTICEGNGVFVTLYVEDKSHFSNKSYTKDDSISRIEMLNQVLRNPKATTEAVLDQYMNAAIELTQSQIGYLYLYDERTKLFTLNNWSNGVMDVCQVTEPKTQYKLDKTGIWGEVVRQRRAIIINDYDAENPLKKGTPAGHAPLHRWMSIPIWSNDQIVGVLGLANKSTDYDAFDLHEVDILMKNVWTLISLIHASEELTLTETLLRASMESQGTVIILDRQFHYLFFNYNHQKTMKSLYGSDVEIGHNIFDYIDIKEDVQKEKERYNKALSGNTFSELDVYGENHDQYFETKYSPVVVEDAIIGISIFTTNVTARIKELERVKDSEEKFRLIYSTMSQGLAIHEIITDEHNNPIDYRCIEVNDSYLKLFNYTREFIVGKRIKEVAPLLEDYWIQAFGKVALTGEPIYLEDYSKSVEKYLSVYAYCPKIGQFAVLISDVTSRIEREKKIEFLSYNDQLTGLHNRRYYEETIQHLDNPKFYPLSIIIGDVNGLKLVNDSFGHQVGDRLLQKVSEIMIQCCRNSDVITRIGGDEFVILLPNTNKEQVLQVVDRINQESEKNTIDSIEVSVSFGCGTKTEASESINQLFKEAEDDMYRNKIIDSRSMRSKTMDLIMTTLYETNEREMFHSKRVSGYCEALGKAMMLDNESVNLLKSAGLFHDIGKIGISDSILNKQGQLTNDEYDMIKKHSEIGYRILSSLPEFGDIAIHILEHHERYDGLGYPNGLKGEEISVQGRIISIVDAYDAMTGPRPYKPSISKQEAIEELKRCRGTQFDPNIVDMFIEQVLK